jgi:ATP adenylyltransferase
MQRLWAPWRQAYIGAKKKKTCFFCKFAHKKPGLSNYILKRNAYAYTLMNIFPYNAGHLMVAPLKHLDCLSRLRQEEMLGLMELVSESCEVLKKVLKPDGFNLGLNLGEVAGAGIVGHLHFHIVPRWKGDTNFMPVCAQTKVVSHPLDAIYKKLKKGYK